MLNFLDRNVEKWNNSVENIFAVMVTFVRFLGVLRCKNVVKSFFVENENSALCTTTFPALVRHKNVAPKRLAYALPNKT